MNKDQMVEKLSSCDIGLERGSLKFVVYNSSWLDTTSWVQSLIGEASQGIQKIQLEHIGSTSVPGLIAKPILDIMLVYFEELLDQKLIESLEGLGFTYKGDMLAKLYQSKPNPGRHLFTYYDTPKVKDYIHIHAFSNKTMRDEITEKLGFKQALLANPENIIKYNKLKEDFITRGISRAEYRVSKTDFVHDLLKKS